MRLVIADDHWSVRDGLKWMLSDHDEIGVVGEAEDGAALLALLDGESADVVLLDVNMPGMGGLEALEAIQEDHPEVRVLMLSMYDDPLYVKRAIELGAAGYLLKNAGRDELIAALTVVASGGVYLQAEVTGPLLREVGAGGADQPRLTPREREVVGLIAKGCENRQIAEELGISETTVKSYVQSAFIHLGVKTRAEAVAVALRSGLID
jgi:DNA-binding NarL/FixJ family response regulator